MIRFSYIGEVVIFEKKEPTYLKTLNFVEKTLYFAVKKWCVNEYLKRRQKYGR